MPNAGAGATFTVLGSIQNHPTNGFGRGVTVMQLRLQTRSQSRDQAVSKSRLKGNLHFCNLGLHLM